MIRNHGRRGQVLVEFAFAASIFFTLLFAVIEFSRALYAYDMIGQAARVATRYASVNTPPLQDCSLRYDATPLPGACQKATMDYLLGKSNIAPADLKSPDTTISYNGIDPLCSTFPKPGVDHGCYVTVHLAYKFSFVGLPIASVVLHSTSQYNLTSQ